MYGCQMSMAVMEIPRDRLIDQAAACVGVTYFIEQAQQSDVSLFI
jgi:peroxiredoxin family protein